MKTHTEIGIESIVSKTNSVIDILSNISANITYVSCKIECGKLPEPVIREKDESSSVPMSANCKINLKFKYKHI